MTELHYTELAAETPTVQTAAFFRAAVHLGLPVALWRQPGETGVAGLISYGPPSTTAAVDLGQTECGFVLAPFSDDSPALVLQADARLAGGLLTTRPGVHREALLATLAAPADDSAPAWYAGPVGMDREVNEAEFAAMVSDAVRFIRERRIAKVVVSRTSTVDLPSGFDPAALFEALCTRYPDAFVSLVAVPGVGTWIGASPELLLALEAGNLRTMALAGTQRLLSDSNLASIVWGAKERVEQEMVTDYIRSVFAEAGVAPIVEHGPHSAAAGSVAHLQTLFQTAEPVTTAQANAVLDRLHPTSAVCGMPRPQALQFIEAREGYDRGFYSGYLGPVHCDGRSTLYVNLRCMQVRARTASLYMGAGVTADSVPAAEWAETALKARTILDVLDAAATGPAPLA